MCEPLQVSKDKESLSTHILAKGPGAAWEKYMQAGQPERGMMSSKARKKTHCEATLMYMTRVAKRKECEPPMGSHANEN